MASAVYNGFVADVEQDLNTPRPIVAGGTGSSSAAQSLFNLGAEMSSQVVTNYDAQVWVPGSFYSAAGATNAPVAGHAFVGTVVSSDVPAYPPANLNVVVSARDQNDTTVPGVLWVREKKAGVWGAWVSTASNLALQEVSSQAVTNFDTQLLLPGSFYSAGTAVNPPVAAHAFVGWVVSSDVPAIPPLNQNVVVHARDQNDTVVPGKLWVREKKAGAWGAWTWDGAVVQALAAGISGKNRVINGAMEIDQRSEGAAMPIPSGAAIYGIDRWQVATSATSSATMTRSTDAPVGQRNSLWLQNGAASSNGAADYLQLRQTIEGFNIADLGFGTASPQTLTLSFWVKGSIAGNYTLCFLSGDNVSRSLPQPYTINAANVWEYKTITIAADAAGTWSNTNAAGLTLTWMLGCGSTWWTSSTNWQAGVKLFITGGTQFYQTAGASFQLAGVQFERGSVATTFERRQYATELSLCGRYFKKLGGEITGDVFFGGGYGVGSGAGAGMGTVPLDPPMRVAPTFTQVGAWSSANLQVCQYLPSKSSFGWQVVAAGAGTVVNLTAGGSLFLNAEL